MPIKNSTQQQEINRRRQLVSKLRHEGVRAQADIVERLRLDYEIAVTQQTVSLDLKALDQLWRNSAISNTDKWKREVAEQYRYLYQQSLTAWELSLEDAEESTTGGKDGATEKVKGQSGNPAHLRNAQESLKAMREMFGLDAPTKSQTQAFAFPAELWPHATPDENTALITADGPQMMAIAAAIRERLAGGGQAPKGQE